MKKSLLALIPLLSACGSEPPTNIGVENGRLAPCPESPNCVSSFATDATHAIEPLAANLDQIRQVLLSLERANIVREETNYLHAEFTSRIMRFVDDVEFLHDPETGLTHVRSASRVGYSDLSANRDRIENLRSALATDRS